MEVSAERIKGYDPCFSTFPLEIKGMLNWDLKT